VASAAVGTAAGVVGGALLGRRLRSRRKVLGIPVPTTRGGFDGLAGQVGKAAKELGRLASQVQATRETAEKVGKALS
jgi:Na+/glutamate symporter